MMGRYGNGLYKQLEEQIEKSERLEQENRQLKQEVASLRKMADKLLTDMEDRIDKAVARVTASLIIELGQKDEQIHRLTDEVARLKAQINKDSSNSGKPPSSNGFKKIPNNREPSGRKSGGQKGHKGYSLRIPENLKELVRDGKAQHVIVSQVGEGEAYWSDWIVDIKTTVVYTEIRRAVEEPQTRRLGTTLQALCIWLVYKGLMSLERVSEFVQDITGGLVKPSEDTIQRFAKTAAANIDLSGYEEDLLNGLVMHVDETPIKTTQRPQKDGRLERAKATTLNAYIRCYSNSTTTILTANARKDEEGVRLDNILSRFCGIVVQDDEAKFYKFGIENAACGVHLCRELKGMAELSMITWASRFRSFMLSMNDKKNDDLAHGKTACEPLLLCHYEQWYDDLVRQGEQELASRKPRTLGYNELRNMVSRVQKRKDNYLLFIRNYAVPFSNNQAERDLRHCKTRQRVSGCFRSWQGISVYCKIRSLLDTARKRGLPIFNQITSCLPFPLPG